MQDDYQTHGTGRALRNGWWLAFLGFVAIALFLLTTEHRAHLLGILPFILLAACPLLHILGHSGHGAHQSEPDKRQGLSQPKSEPPHQH